MAIAPNTTFVSGAVLTAAQQNAFGFGVVAFATSTATPAAITSSLATVLTSSTFTAIANRYYKITYFEPVITASSGTVTFIQGTLNNGATALATGTDLTSNERSQVSIFAVTTFTAGSITITAKLQTNSGTATANRSATGPAILLVEDIGPA